MESLFKKNNFDIVKGAGTLEKENSILITGSRNQTSETKIHASRVILATGSEPLKSERFNFGGKKTITSDEAFELKKTPKSIVIVGGGAVGCHFAAIFNKLGSKVTLIEMKEQILPGEDEEIVKILTGIFQRKGIQVLTSTKIGTGLVPVRAEITLVAAGRKLLTENLPVKKDKDRVVVNEKMETDLPGVYAVGDITGKWLLAHVASAQGRVAAENACGKESSMDYRVIPRTYSAFCEFAAVGLTEKEAAEKGEIKVGRSPFASSAKAMILGEREGFVKIIADKKTNEILGLHILGPQAGSLIGEGALAIKLRARTNDLAELIHAHPTLSETIQEAARQIYDK